MTRDNIPPDEAQKIKTIMSKLKMIKMKDTSYVNMIHEHVDRINVYLDRAINRK